MLHLAFDAMVGICSVLILLGLWLGIAWWRKRDIPTTPWFLRAMAVSGVAAIVALECGWIVTEVGRQPWIVYEVMRTEDAVTDAERRLDHARRRVRRLRAARSRHDHGAARDVRAAGAKARATTSRCRTGRAPADGWRPAVSSADAVAGVLWVGVTLYAVFGGADFGAASGPSPRAAASAARGRAG